MALLRNKDVLFTPRKLLNLLWPLLVEQLLSVLIGMIDVVMVASLGEAAVSGVSLVDSINHLILQLLLALTTGGTVACAQFIGSRDTLSASKSIAQLVFISVLALSVITAFFLLAGKHMLALIFGSVESVVMSNAVLYMRITALSFPFLALYHACSAGFRATGNTRVSMLVSLGMNILNIAGNAICIFVFHMGVVGVAIPTLMARAIGAGAILSLYQLQKNTISIRQWRQIKPDRAMLTRILAIGIPGSVESTLFNAGKIALQSLVSSLGTPSIAAYAVGSNLVTYLYLPGNAIGAGMTTIVAQCHGAGAGRQARDYAKLLMALNYGMLAVICAVLISWRGFWVSCYLLTAPASVYAEELIFVHSVAMLIWPTAFLMPYYFRAIGRARFTMAVALFAMAVFRVALAYVFIRMLNKDVLWIWYAMFADWAFRTVVYCIAFQKESTRRKAA